MNDKEAQKCAICLNSEDYLEILPAHLINEFTLFKNNYFSDFLNIPSPFLIERNEKITQVSGPRSIDIETSLGGYIFIVLRRKLFADTEWERGLGDVIIFGNGWLSRSAVKYDAESRSQGILDDYSGCFGSDTFGRCIECIVGGLIRIDPDADDTTSVYPSGFNL